MRKLTLALFHVEPCIADEPDAATAGYALGAVRFIELHPGPKGAIHRVRRATNTHFGPVPLLDDLLRPWVDVAVAYDARSLDLALAAAIWPSSVYHFTAASSVDAIRERIAAAGFQARVETHHHLEVGEVYVGPRDVVDRVGARVVGHSSLIPGSLIGLAAEGKGLLEELQRRTFTVTSALDRTTGHPRLCELGDWGETLSHEPVPHATAPSPAPRPDVEPELFASAYAGGRLWAAVTAVHTSLGQLEELVHAGVYGQWDANLRTNRVRTDRGWVESLRVEDPHARFAYRIPTGEWYRQIQEIAAGNNAK